MTDTSSNFSLDLTLAFLDEKHHFIGEAYDRYRPTASFILTDKKGSVLLVQPAADSTRKGWIPPQGGVRAGESVQAAMRRELWKELRLDLSVDHLLSQAVLLGSYINTIRGDDKPKLIVSVGLVLSDEEIDQIKLNDENRKYCFVGSQYDMWSRMSGTRPVKLLGTCLSVNIARQHNLTRWTCDDVIAQFSSGREVAAA